MISSARIKTALLLLAASVLAMALVSSSPLSANAAVGDVANIAVGTAPGLLQSVPMVQRSM